LAPTKGGIQIQTLFNSEQYQPQLSVKSLGETPHSCAPFVVRRAVGIGVGGGERIPHHTPD